MKLKPAGVAGFVGIERKIMINKITGYVTSRDYNQLWELAENQSIVCLSSHGVGQTIEDDGYREIIFRVTEVFAWKIDDFVEQCKRLKIEFIVPNKMGEETG